MSATKRIDRDRCASQAQHIILLRTPKSDRLLDIKIAFGIHILMRNANNIDHVLDGFIENQVHAFGEAIVFGFYICTLLLGMAGFEHPAE